MLIDGHLTFKYCKNVIRAYYGFPKYTAKTQNIYFEFL